MRTHHDNGEPFGVESLFTQLDCRLMAILSLAHGVIDGRGGDAAVKALAEGVIWFEEDFEMAREAATEAEAGHVRRYTVEKIGGAQ